MAKLRGCKVWRGILRLVWLGKFGMGAFLRFLFLLCAVATSAFGQGPQVKDGHPYIDDKSLLGNENGFRRWTYTIKPVAAPPLIASRGATTKEARVVEQAKFLLASREAKAIVLMDGPSVIYAGLKEPATEKTLFASASMGKTVTALAVGQAICAGKIKLEDRAAALMPELEGKALGNATVRDLLRMASGAAEANTGPTKGSGYIFTAQEETDLRAGKFDIVHALSSDRLASAAHGTFSDYKPGEQFAYKATDPLTLGILLNRATGVSTAQWMQRMVFDQAGLAESGRLNTLCAASAGVFCSDGKQAVKTDAGVFLHLNDWIRFAWWVKRASKKSDCFGKFVNEAAHTQISTAKPGTKWGKNSVRGYGYLIWTDNPIAPDTFWAEGWGGQRIGWNYKNDRMVISFSNHEIWIPELYALYRDWMNAAD